MKRILMCFSYKGTNFCGYQIQKNKRTVQGEIQNTLFEIFKQKIVIFASGRTDAGVHAIKQYAHFECDISFDATKLVYLMNDKLPEDIRVIETKLVENDFHARFNVKKKTYMYVIQLGEINPIINDLVCNVDYKLDFNKIDLCLPQFIGEHNFKGFCCADTNATTFNRIIYDIHYIRDGNCIKFFISGNGFLYNMVRIIIGTIIDIGRGKTDISVLEKMFNSGDRSLGGKTLSASGLYLYDIEY